MVFFSGIPWTVLALFLFSFFFFGGLYGFFDIFFFLPLFSFFFLSLLVFFLPIASSAELLAQQNSFQKPFGPMK